MQLKQIMSHCTAVCRAQGGAKGRRGAREGGSCQRSVNGGAKKIKIKRVEGVRFCFFKYFPEFPDFRGLLRRHALFFFCVSFKGAWRGSKSQKWNNALTWAAPFFPKGRLCQSPGPPLPSPGKLIPDAPATSHFPSADSPPHC